MNSWLDLYQDTDIMCIFDLENKKNRCLPVSKIKKIEFTDKLNVFFTPNCLGYRRIDGVNTIRRDREHFNTFEALYCDIDLKMSDYEMDEEELFQYLSEELWGEDCDLVEPTMVNCSGHGLHLYWKIESTSYRGNIEKWELVQEYIYNCLKKYGADSSVTKDRVRVLRVAGSLNKKADMPVVKCENMLFTGKVYNLDALIERYELENEVQKITKRNRSGKQSKKAPKKPRNRAIVYNVSFSDGCTRMYMKRIEELKRLALYRGEGSRERILFLFNNYMQLAIQDKDMALEKTLELNSMLKVPLTEKEVIEQAQARKIYKYSANRICEWLEITEEEIRALDLRSIVPRSMKKAWKEQKNKEYYADKLKREGRTTKKSQVEERRIKIAILLEQGKSEQEIIDILEIGRRTYYNDKKVISTEQWQKDNKEAVKMALQEVTEQVILVFVEDKLEQDRKQLHDTYLIAKHYKEPLIEKLLKVPI